MRYTGIDWAGKGWFALTLDEDGDPSAGFYPTILNWYHEAEEPGRVLIDVPIGLAKDRRRTADEAAREYLGEAARSVFGTPVREAVYAENLERAKEIHEDREVGFGIQNQAWGIVPRIREVDVFLQEYDHLLDGEFRESHPEVCFAAMNGGEAIADAKTTEDGRERRLELLEPHLDDPHDLLDDLERRFASPSYAPTIKAGALDDVVDAMGLAAAASHADLVSLPEEPRTDFALGREVDILRPPESSG